MEKELFFTLNFDSITTKENRESLLMEFLDNFVDSNGFSVGGNFEGMGVYNYQDSMSCEELQSSIENFFKKNEKVISIEYQKYNNSNDSFDSYKEVIF